ncbi:MAG: carbonic anhydrase [Acidobacteriota bacterium]
MRFSALICLLLGATLAGAQADSTGWTYTGRTGPINWSKLDPAYRACSQGREQSPVDIRGAHLNTSLQPLEFHYLAGSVTVENTGNLIVVHVNPGSYMVSGGTRYELDHLEFHHPSEHAVRGRLTDMDVELVHKSAEGKMAIISVRLALDRGDPNATLATLWEHLPTKPHTTEKVPGMVNPGGFLPGDRGYWTYMGSLTTPPCTEGVRWFVMEQALSISRDQLQAIERLFRVSSRPLEDLHGRRIEANE